MSLPGRFFRSRRRRDAELEAELSSHLALDIDARIAR